MYQQTVARQPSNVSFSIGWKRQIGFTTQGYEDFNRIRSQNHSARRSYWKLHWGFLFPSIVCPGVDFIIDFYINERLLFQLQVTYVDYI
jgi:hypothetical protein